MADYIGLQISGAALNAVRLSTGAKKMALEDRFTARYTDDASLAAALKECAARFAAAEGAEWSVGLPMAEFSFRHLSFPFKGRGQIAAAIGFEMEAALPFAAEQLAASFAILSAAKEGSTVLACAIRKERLDRYRRLCAEAGIAARLFAPDTTGLLYFYRSVILPAQSAEPASAVIAAAEEEQLHLCAVTKEGFIDFLKTDADEHALDRFAAALPAEPEKRFVGGAQAARLGRITGQELWKRQIAATLDDPANEGADRLMVPIGLAALASSSGDELVFAGGARRKLKFMNDWRIAAAGAAAVAVMLLSFLVFRNYMKERTLAALNEQAKTVFAAAVPGARAVKPVFQLQEKLSKLEAKMRRAGFGGSRTDLLWTLKRMSETLPEGLPMEVDELLYEEESLTLAARTDKLDSATRIKELFSIAPPFKGADLLEAKASPDGRKVTFKMRLAL